MILTVKLIAMGYQMTTPLSELQEHESYSQFVSDVLSMFPSYVTVVTKEMLPVQFHNAENGLFFSSLLFISDKVMGEEEANALISSIKEKVKKLFEAFFESTNTLYQEIHID